MSADMGLIGLAVMGENLVLNMERNGFVVAVYNRTSSKTQDFINGRGKGLKLIGTSTIEELVSHLKSPKRVMIMVRAGQPVDDTISKLVPFMSKGDIIIDGGNSNFSETARRVTELGQLGILFIGTGISGGEEGALNGPSIMPGGSHEAWPHVKDIFQSIAAKVEGNLPCCDWVGSDGAGHFVKTIHNGHEYSCCQTIAEAYTIMKHGLKMSNSEMAQVFSEWNDGDLNSYLIEITSVILKKKDDEGNDVIDYILDAAGQKGTGKWTVFNALDLGMPVTLVAEAVFARCLSSMKKERVLASNILKDDQLLVHDESNNHYLKNKEQTLNDLRDAVYASFLVSCAQCFILMRAAATEYKWSLNYGNIALMWRGGCIIRSKYLFRIYEAFNKDPQLSNLLLDEFFAKGVRQCTPGWRRIITLGVTHGIPMPTISAGLAYYDGLRTAYGSANLIQAQRDYFGAHTYQRIDRDEGLFFHTNWTGHGGTTHSNAYNV